jgi:hypothetical protein
MLDARPGELLGHATLSSRRSTAAGRHAFSSWATSCRIRLPARTAGAAGGPNQWHTPRFAAFTQARRGPDAFACFRCHQGAHVWYADAERVHAGRRRAIRGSAQSRTSSVSDRSPAWRARWASCAPGGRRPHEQRGHRIDQPLTAKTVSFGRIRAEPDGTLDYGALEGVDADLTVRPFGWKGHQATLRGMIEESLHIHQGLISNRIGFAIRDGSLAPDPYGKGSGTTWTRTASRSRSTTR